MTKIKRELIARILFTPWEWRFAVRRYKRQCYLLKIGVR